MKKVKVLILMLFLVSVLISCGAHQYNMGMGPQTDATETQRQWYILWGLVPLNSVDVEVMIGEVENYQVRTASEPIDIIMNIFTGYVTVTSRTVTVKK